MYYSIQSSFIPLPEPKPLPPPPLPRPLGVKPPRPPRPPKHMMYMQYSMRRVCKVTCNLTYMYITIMIKYCDKWKGGSMFMCCIASFPGPFPAFQCYVPHSLFSMQHWNSGNGPGDEASSCIHSIIQILMECTKEHVNKLIHMYSYLVPTGCFQYYQTLCESADLPPPLPPLPRPLPPAPPLPPPPLFCTPPTQRHMNVHDVLVEHRLSLKHFMQCTCTWEL